MNRRVRSRVGSGAPSTDLVVGVHVQRRAGQRHAVHGDAAGLDPWPRRRGASTARAGDHLGDALGKLLSRRRLGGFAGFKSRPPVASPRPLKSPFGAARPAPKLLRSPPSGRAGTTARRLRRARAGCLAAGSLVAGHLAVGRCAASGRLSRPLRARPGGRRRRAPRPGVALGTRTARGAVVAAAALCGSAGAWAEALAAAAVAAPAPPRDGGRPLPPRVILLSFIGR